MISFFLETSFLEAVPFQKGMMPFDMQPIFSVYLLFLKNLVVKHLIIPF